MTAVVELGMVEGMEPETKGIGNWLDSGSRRVVLVAVAAGVLGMLIGVLVGMKVGKNPVIAPVKTNAGANPLILNQSAAATGKITQLQGKTLTLEDANGKSENFQIGDVVTVYKYPLKNAPAQVLSGIGAIELNKEVLLNLNSDGNNFTVVTVTYLEPTSTTSPSATSSGQNI